jgi:hypothetical protein
VGIGLRSALDGHGGLLAVVVSGARRPFTLSAAAALPSAAALTPSIPSFTLALAAAASTSRVRHYSGDPASDASQSDTPETELETSPFLEALRNDA